MKINVDGFNGCANSVKKRATIGILADLQGPKIRIARFKNGSIQLKPHTTFVLDASLPENEGDERAVGLDYKELPRDVVANDVLLLDDGRLELHVVSVDGPRIVCRVHVGGELSNNKVSTAKAVVYRLKR